jgi:uncharacterized membrane protein YqaE (UPF0057 family)
MKKLFSPLLLLTLSVVLISSCSGPSNLAMTKRHYRSGYYVDWGSKRNATTTPVVAKLSAKNETKSNSMSIPKQEIYTAVVAPVITSEKSITPQKTVYHKRIMEIADKTISPASVNQSNTVLTVTGINSTTAVTDVRVDANVAFVVIVLCAIFIPPLGVGLMYGIHGYFWIDLILTLLFFFPGMIFALVVVLM